MASAAEYQNPQRMAQKLAAVPFPVDLTGMSVLDVGCDQGWWCKLASDRGAARVVGIDRGRPMGSRGGAFVDLVTENQAKNWPRCEFVHANIGLEWPDVGEFDVVLCFSMYHHIWSNCGNHDAIWRWLRRRVMGPQGTLLWEGPTSAADSVAARSVVHRRLTHRGAEYVEVDIHRAAEAYFRTTFFGAAGHVPTREVWQCAPRPTWEGTVRVGAGGASKAFLYAQERRRDEIGNLLHARPYPGSLNVELDRPFDWFGPHVEGMIADVQQRGKGLQVPWVPRKARFYPVTVNGVNPAWAFRFDGEKYPLNFIELVSPLCLRDHLHETRVLVCQP